MEQAIFEPSVIEIKPLLYVVQHKQINKYIGTSHTHFKEKSFRYVDFNMYDFFSLIGIQFCPIENEKHVLYRDQSVLTVCMATNDRTDISLLREKTMKYS